MGQRPLRYNRETVSVCASDIVKNLIRYWVIGVVKQVAVAVYANKLVLWHSVNGFSAVESCRDTGDSNAFACLYFRVSQSLNNCVIADQLSKNNLVSSHWRLRRLSTKQ